MDGSWLDGYLEAWKLHSSCVGRDGEVNLTQLLAYMGPDVRYEDVPGAAVFVGHDGIREMTKSASQMSSDLLFVILRGVCDGRTFAFESICRGTNTGAVGTVPATGRFFEFRLAAVGQVSEQGLVTAQRDYWDLAGLLVQLGVAG
jgi:predicted ester cyclase